MAVSARLQVLANANKRLRDCFPRPVRVHSTTRLPHSVLVLGNNTNLELFVFVLGDSIQRFISINAPESRAPFHLNALLLTLARIHGRDRPVTLPALLLGREYCARATRI